MAAHPRVPWVTYEPWSEGGFLLTDTRTGEQAWAEEASGIETFAADHSAEVGARGLGDLFAVVAKPIASAMGLDPGCTPCAEKQQMLNMLFPHLGKR